MDSLFGSLKSFFRAKPVTIDNFAFQIHYRASFVVLIAFSLLVTSRQYFGDPIDCISKDDVPSKLLDSYCWIHTTFSVENAWKKTVGVEVPYPGVDKSTPSESRVYHAYYQWVCFVLFFQALGFYAPRFFWKHCEDNLTSQLSKDLASPTLSDQGKVQAVANYLSSTSGHHNGLFYIYVFAEVWNFANVIIQMYLMNLFLGGAFTDYGWQVLSFTEWDWNSRYDPMIRVFPRLTKCNFHRYGSSGDVQKYDAMCILPINIVNEKIYVFLWFWFYGVAIISALSLVYRLITIVYPAIRVKITRSKSRQVPENMISDYVSKVKIGDWFLLDMIAKNIYSQRLREILDKLLNDGTKNLNL